MKNLLIFLVALATFSLGGQASAWTPGWNWDPGKDPVASARITGVAHSDNNGVIRDSDSVVDGYTKTSVSNFYGWPTASFSFDAWGRTGTFGVGLGQLSMGSVLSLHGSGNASASKNDVGAKIGLNGLAFGVGVGDLVFGEQVIVGEIGASGHDQPYNFQGVSTGGYGRIEQNMTAYSFDGGPAAVSLESHISLSDSVNP